MTRSSKFAEKVFSAVCNAGGRFVRANIVSARLFIPMLKKPAVLFLWISRSYLAHAILLAALLLTPTVASNLSDRLMESIYQPVNKKILGLISFSMRDPRLEERKILARQVLWTGSGLTVFFAFWFAIPAAIRRGEEMASDKETEADALLDAKPSSSILIYRSAMNYATDEEHLSTLREKLEAVDRLIQETAVKGGGTVVMKRPSPPTFLPAERYAIEKELGRGTMGVVLLALDKTLERKVAIKELPPSIAGNEELLKRFRREAKLLARMNHPSIVQVYDFVELSGSAWIVMEFVEGRELEAAIAGGTPVEPFEAARLAVQMAEALSYAHKQGILHRDLKPANIIVDRQGRAKIMDFGVARLMLAGEQTEAGTILGSPAFMSPEQAMGSEVDERTDIYSLGATLYMLLTAKQPFTGSAVEVLGQVLHSEPEGLEEKGLNIPVGLAKLIKSMMSKNPEDRPSSMEAVKAAFEEYANIA